MSKKKANKRYYIQTKLIREVDDRELFERKINEFAKDHYVVGIKYQCFQSSDWYKTDSALIMYRVYEEVDE